MAELGRCVVFEWGWQFLAVVAGATVVLVIALVLLARFFKLNLPSTTPDEGEAKGITLKGPVVRFLVFVGLVVAIGYAIYFAYDKFHASYAVLFNSTSAPDVNLESLRSKFQGETHATIIISDRAKAFSVAGRYEGACPPDFFESICRQYSDRLSCNASLLDRTLTVDAK